MNHALKQKYITYFPLILLIFHCIGIGLFLYPDRIKNLSGFNMLLCALLVFFASVDWNKELKLLLGINLGGFLVEAIGVNTGLFFGIYEYGNELGLKILGVPVVLGLNWYCIVASSSHLVQRLANSQALILKSFLSALLAVGMDYLIEPVAIQYDFWAWEGGAIPIFNYVCWFLFSFVFAFFYIKNITTINRTAIALYGIWALFFIILNIV